MGGYVTPNGVLFVILPFGPTIHPGINFADDFPSRSISTSMFILCPLLFSFPNLYSPSVYLHTGMFRAVMSEKSVNGKWQVVFSEFYTDKDIADIMVKEEDWLVHDQMPPDRFPPR